MKYGFFGLLLVSQWLSAQVEIAASAGTRDGLWLPAAEVNYEFSSHQFLVLRASFLDLHRLEGTAFIEAEGTSPTFRLSYRRNLIAKRGFQNRRLGVHVEGGGFVRPFLNMDLERPLSRGIELDQLGDRFVLQGNFVNGGVYGNVGVHLRFVPRTHLFARGGIDVPFRDPGEQSRIFRPVLIKSLHTSELNFTAGFSVAFGR